MPRNRPLAPLAGVKVLGLAKAGGYGGRHAPAMSAVCGGSRLGPTFELTPTVEAGRLARVVQHKPARHAGKTACRSGSGAERGVRHHCASLLACAGPFAKACRSICSQRSRVSRLLHRSKKYSRLERARSAAADAIPNRSTADCLPRLRQLLKSGAPTAEQRAVACAAFETRDSATIGKLLRSLSTRS